MNDSMDCLVLSEAVAASLDDWHAKSALAPEFTLRELEELHLFPGQDFSNQEGNAPKVNVLAVRWGQETYIYENSLRYRSGSE